MSNKNSLIVLRQNGLFNGHTLIDQISGKGAYLSDVLRHFVCFEDSPARAVEDLGYLKHGDGIVLCVPMQDSTGINGGYCTINFFFSGNFQVRARIFEKMEAAVPDFAREIIVP